MPFLEEQLATDQAFGSSAGASFAVDIHETLVNRYATLRHPYVTAIFDLRFNNKTPRQQIDKTIDVFNRAGGRGGGCRFKNTNEYTTNDYIKTPTAYDQRAVETVEPNTDDGGTWQIHVWYGDPDTSGVPRRRILKPVSGTVKYGIEDAAGQNKQMAQTATVDTTTGKITIPSNINASITNITQASQAEITLSSVSGLSTDHSVIITGVSGMTEINGLRGNIVEVATDHIVVDINTSAFSAYTSGGEVDTNPQTDQSEYLTAGCEFDIPVMFEADLDGIAEVTEGVISNSLRLIEVRNPEDL